MKAVVAAFNQEKALVGAFSVITNLRIELFEALLNTLAQSAWTIYLANSGHWELQEDGYSLGYENTAPGCGPLLGSLDPGLWRYSSNTGFTMQIRLRSVA